MAANTVVSNLIEKYETREEIGERGKRVYEEAVLQEGNVAGVGVRKGDRRR